MNKYTYGNYQDGAYIITVNNKPLSGEQVVDNLAQLEEELEERNMTILAQTCDSLKAKNEALRKLAHDYIQAYEKLAFGEEQGDE